jgi:hypothetical protein
MLDWWKTGLASSQRQLQPYVQQQARQQVTPASSGETTSGLPNRPEFMGIDNGNLGKYLSRKWDLQGIGKLMGFDQMPSDWQTAMNDPSRGTFETDFSSMISPEYMKNWQSKDYYGTRDLGA